MTTDDHARCYLEARAQLEALLRWLDTHGDNRDAVRWFLTRCTRLSRAVQERGEV